MKIVSLVPSLTHMLCDMGLRDMLVGCTKFCVHPPGLHKSCTMIGGTKDPDMTLIASLDPDLIFANVEENKPEHIAACRDLAEVCLTDIRSPADVPAL